MAAGILWSSGLLLLSLMPLLLENEGILVVHDAALVAVRRERRRTFY
jgi:hypothetical protein